MTYFLVTLPLEPGLTAPEVSSMAAKAVRSAIPKLSRGQLVQLPLVDGGVGTVEHLVTHSLGSFLEVEATNADGDQVIIPFGLLGEESRMAVIEMKSVAGVSLLGADTNESSTTKSRSRKKKSSPFSGTTSGIGELITDALDENAFSIILGWDEPLARDAGLGMGAALGVKYLDKSGKVLDVGKNSGDTIPLIHSIDVSGRPFSLLSSRFFVAKSSNIETGESKQYSVDDTIFEEELSRLSNIVQRDSGVKIDVASIKSPGSAIEFGLQAFLPSEIKDGSALVLEATGVLEQIQSLRSDAFVIIVSEKADDVIGKSRPQALSLLLETVRKSESLVTLLTSQPVSPRDRTRAEKDGVSSVNSLVDAKVFLSPLPIDAEIGDVRRDRQIRMERIMPDLLSQVVSQGAAA